MKAYHLISLGGFGGGAPIILSRLREEPSSPSLVPETMSILIYHGPPGKEGREDYLCLVSPNLGTDGRDPITLGPCGAFLGQALKLFIGTNYITMEIIN